MATTTALTENSCQGINSKIPPCVGLAASLNRSSRPGCGHAYDETPVGLVVYVRNDPVNRVDPDGRTSRSVGNNPIGSINPGTGFVSSMTISDAGAAFIANYETFQSKIYTDEAGNPTIGFGHLVTEAERDKYADGITYDQALQLFKSDLTIYIESVNKAVTVDLSQNQFDALVSLAFNIGGTKFSRSALVTAINSGKSITEHLFTSWNLITLKDGRRVPSNGLTARRNDEFELFMFGDYNRGPRPIVWKAVGGGPILFDPSFDLIDIYDGLIPGLSALDEFVAWVSSIEVKPIEIVSVRISF